MPVIDQSPYRKAIGNYPQLERLAQQRIAQAQRQQLGEEKLASQQQGREEHLQFEQQKEAALEGYRARALALTEKAQRLRSLQLESEMAYREFQMNKEMAQIQETKQQMSDMTKAVSQLSKINPKSPDFREKIAEIRTNYPNAFKQSKNGEETFVHEFEKSIYDEHKEHIAGAQKLSDELRVNPVFKENGDIDVEAMRSRANELRQQEVSGDIAVAGSLGMKPTGMEETQHGQMYHFGKGGETKQTVRQDVDATGKPVGTKTITTTGPVVTPPPSNLNPVEEEIRASRAAEPPSPGYVPPPAPGQKPPLADIFK